MQVSLLMSDNNKGFSLVEMMLALVLALFIMATTFKAFTAQREAYHVQEQITQMQQSVRAAMDMMVYDIEMAGYDPNDGGFLGIILDPNQLHLRADLNGDTNINLYGSDEDILYTYDQPNKMISRTTAAQIQPFAEDIKEFSIEYLDPNGAAATTSADIRQVRITIVGQTEKRDQRYLENGGRRTYKAVGLVTPKNLGF